MNPSGLGSALRPQQGIFCTFRSLFCRGSMIPASRGPRADYKSTMRPMRTRKRQPTPVLLPGESQGRGSLVGCRLWDRTEVDTTRLKLLSSSSGSMRLMYSTARYCINLHRACAFFIHLSLLSMLGFLMS